MKIYWLLQVQIIAFAFGGSLPMGAIKQKEIACDLHKRYNRYADDDNDDCKSMEADFTTILMEKKKSARIGKKEYEEEYAKIQEEERRE